MSSYKTTTSRELPISQDPLLEKQKREDSWQNATLGLGGSRDKSTDFSIIPVIPLSIEQLNNLYMGDDMCATIVDSIPEDALSKNIIIHCKESERLQAAFEHFGGITKFIEAWRWGRLFGGGAIFMGVQDADQASPLNFATHGRILYTMVLERSEMQPASYYSDPSSIKFGTPKTYRVTPQNNNHFGLQVSRGGNSEALLSYGKEVHESRLLMFGGAPTPSRFKQMNNGWDASVLQRVYVIIRDYNSIWRNANYALADMSQGVFKIKGLFDMISEGQADQLIQRMELVDLARSIARSVIVDAEYEDFSVVGSANLNSISPILEQANTRVASCARMPLTRLMGTSPGGLNSTGDGDLSNWYGVIDVARETIARPKLEKYLKIIGRSINVDTTDLQIEFPQLWSLSDLEMADLRNKQANTDQQYISMGVLTPQEVRTTRFVNATDPELDTVNVKTEVIQTNIVETKSLITDITSEK